jgi:signal transduction histidine kinase
MAVLMPIARPLPLPWLALAATLLGASATAAGADGPDRAVLVLYSNSRLLPANVEGERGLRQAIFQAGSPVALFDEFLDFPRFQGPDQERTVATYLRDKYAKRPPRVIVVAGEGALSFLLRDRAMLFPGVPVVHMGISRPVLRSIQPLPADVVGIPIEWDFGRTIRQALRWQPKARRVLVAVGASEEDRRWESLLRAEAGRLGTAVEVDFLSGLPAETLSKRLREAGEESVVFTTGWFRDGNGREAIPRESVAEMALVSTAPIYVPFSTFMGTGAVGGYMPTFESMGREAGRLVNRILAGEPPGSLHPADVMPLTLNVDWRQLRRWRIDASAVPGDAVIQFRKPGLVQEHPGSVAAGLSVLVIQAVLISGLLFERRRRLHAEQDVQEKRFELAHASRLAVAGELTASIAHEINQPLGAILSNADAADLILEAGGDRREELRAILADIRRDDLRASEVIRRLRSLLARHEVEKHPFEVNQAILETEATLRAEARRRDVTVEVRPAAKPMTITGDRIQVQQVATNLLLNAMDAVDGLPEERRTIVVSIETDGRVARMDVSDSGHGIPPEHLPRLFSSFFSTKRKGMGLGLSIARTLVEAHEGRIWAENVPGNGAVFHVEFPLTGSSVQAPVEAA